MGFTVSEPLIIPRFEISVEGAYVTLKGSCVLSKRNWMPMSMGMPISMGESPSFVVSGRYCVYANPNAPEPLLTENISLSLEQAPSNPLSALYAHLKTQAEFAGKTLTDC